eukprot:TRINITY_DN44647_c0_g1_i4.p1 TRINITY_DN44647_c0_g1~~TRINITY_DN44647_c0_g1_i4.p1  ORF type:complete len:257 (-),score=44.97 TRINITY_DN44647_c0_g1_i4:50-820(-)
MVLALACQQRWPVEVTDSEELLQKAAEAVQRGNWRQTLNAMPKTGVVPDQVAFRIKHKECKLSKAIDRSKLYEAMAEFLCEHCSWNVDMKNFDVEVVVEVNEQGIAAGLFLPSSCFEEMSKPHGNKADPSTRLAKKSEVPLPDWFLQVRQEAIVNYDTSAYPFREVLAAVFKVDPDALPLLHTLPLTDDRMPMHPKLGKAYAAAGHVLPSSFRWDSSTQKAVEESDAYRTFCELYTRFVKEVVAPLCGSDRVLQFA